MERKEEDPLKRRSNGNKKKEKRQALQSKR